MDTPWAPKQLARDGAYIGQHRLPEFEFAWKGHPIHVVGPQMFCMICNNATVMTLAVANKGSSPCVELRNYWVEHLTPLSTIDARSQTPFLNSERLSKIARCVMASTLQAICDELEVSPLRARKLYVDHREAFLQNKIDKMKEGRKYNIPYEDWLPIMDFWTPEMEKAFSAARASGNKDAFISITQALSSANPELYRELLKADKKISVFTRSADITRKPQEDLQLSDVINSLRVIPDTRYSDQDMKEGIFLEILSKYKIPRAPIPIQTDHGVIEFTASGPQACATHNPNNRQCTQYIKRITKQLGKEILWYAYDTGSAIEQVTKEIIALLPFSQSDLEQFGPRAYPGYKWLSTWAAYPRLWFHTNEVKDMLQAGCPRLETAMALVGREVTRDEAQRWWKQGIDIVEKLIWANTMAKQCPQFTEGEICRAAKARFEFYTTRKNELSQILDSAAFVEAINSGWPLPVIKTECPNGTLAELEALLKLGPEGRLLIEDGLIENETKRHLYYDPVPLSQFAAPNGWERSILSPADSQDDEGARRARLTRQLEIEALQAAQNYKRALAALIAAREVAPAQPPPSAAAPTEQLSLL